MINFIISIVVFAATVFMLGVTVRYGLIGAGRMDNYFSEKNNSIYPGFQWYFRIPFSIGVIPEYYYAMVLGHDNYFTKNWWALKSASFISVLVFIAGIKSRSAVSAYFSMSFLQDKGILGFFTSGNFVNFMNIIVVLYLALFILICIESIRMHGVYAPARIIVYSFLSLFMANLTVITLSIIVFVAVIYLIYKIIKFFFFTSKNKDTKSKKDEETASSILSGGLSEFRTELYEWEEDEKNNPSVNYTTKATKTKERKRPKITRRRKKKVTTANEVPRLYPDEKQ